MIVGAIGAMTFKSSPIAAPQSNVTSGVAGIAPAPQGASSATSANTASLSGAPTSTGTTFQIPAGTFIVPAPSGKQSSGNYESEESHSGTSSSNHEGSGERD